MSISLRYFAYGSNMHSPRLRARVGDVRIIGRATAHDYVHRFDKRGNDGSAKGNVHPHSGERVFGVVYELTVSQFDTLITFEGGYRLGEITIATTDDVDRVKTFFGENLGDALVPTPEYLEHYRRGVAEHGIPLAYYDEITAMLRTSS